MEVIKGKITGIMLYENTTSTVQIEGSGNTKYRLEVDREKANALAPHFGKPVIVRLDISEDSLDE